MLGPIGRTPNPNADPNPNPDPIRHLPLRLHSHRVGGGAPARLARQLVELLERGLHLGAARAQLVEQRAHRREPAALLPVAVGCVGSVRVRVRVRVSVSLSLTLTLTLALALTLDLAATVNLTLTLTRTLTLTYNKARG